MVTQLVITFDVCWLLCIVLIVVNVVSTVSEVSLLYIFFLCLFFYRKIANNPPEVSLSLMYPLQVYLCRMPPHKCRVVRFPPSGSFPVDSGVFQLMWTPWHARLVIHKVQRSYPHPSHILTTGSTQIELDWTSLCELGFHITGVRVWVGRPWSPLPLPPAFLYSLFLFQFGAKENTDQPIHTWPEPYV